MSRVSLLCLSHAHVDGLANTDSREDCKSIHENSLIQPQALQLDVMMT